MAPCSSAAPSRCDSLSACSDAGGGWRVGGEGGGGGGANEGPDRRIGFNVTYIPPTVMNTRSEANTALLVRGYDTFNLIEHEAQPNFDESGKAGGAQREAKMDGVASAIMEVRATINLVYKFSPC